MHRLGDVVDVRLVEAAPIAGALRFELLSEGRVAPRGGKGGRAREVSSLQANAHPGRNPRKKDRKTGEPRPGKSKKGKASKDKSWKR
jgi:ribonuclease R